MVAHGWCHVLTTLAFATPSRRAPDVPRMQPSPLLLPDRDGQRLQRSRQPTQTQRTRDRQRSTSRSRSFDMQNGNLASDAETAKAFLDRSGADTISPTQHP